MKITPKHLNLIEMLADPLDTRTHAEKAKEAGFSARTLYNVMKDPDAVRILRERTDLHIGFQRPAAYRCLIQNFREGDRASARDYLQSIGDIGTGGHTSNINVTQTNTDESLDDAIKRTQLERRESIIQDKE